MEKGHNKHVDGASADWYPILKINARQNRRSMTYAEEILWQRIRAKQLGFKFRRQHPILDYIADFVCLERSIIIEVDGGYHNVEEQARLDEYRSERLTKVGYHVIRFTNEEVVENIETVINTISKALNYEF